MILSKPGTLVRLAKVYKSTLVGQHHAPATYQMKTEAKETFEFGKQYQFVAPAGDHPDNPYRHQHKVWPHWDKVFFVTLPFLVLWSIRVAYVEMEEEKHVEKHRPEYIPYEYMYIQRTPFPWGDGKHTLFHNPKRNPVPGVGYEA